MLIDVIRNARVVGQPDLVDVSIADGTVVAVTPADLAAPRRGASLNADGCVVAPGLVDAHVHLDKAFLPISDTASARLADAITTVAEARSMTGHATVVANAERAIDTLVRNGVVAARVHVEVTAAHASLVELHHELATRNDGRIDLQLVAFPQLGFDPPGSIAAMRDALQSGVQVVGACPYVDADPLGHIDAAFALADEFDVPVDFHIDFTDEPSIVQLEAIIDRTNALGLRGQVTVGHVTSLAALPVDAQRAAFDAMAAAGIALVVLPATDLYLGGHGEPGTRSLAPIDRAIARGVRVAIANNNLANPFAPYGNGNLTQAAWLAGLTRRMATPTQGDQLLAAITTAPAAILGRKPHGPTVGASADLVVLDTSDPVHVVAQSPAVLATVMRGYTTDTRKGTLMDAQPLRVQTRNTNGVGYEAMGSFDVSDAPAPAYVLPPAAYRDADWFGRERASLFTNRWTLVCAEAELPNSGDYKAITIGDAPVVVVRGDDGELRAMHNLCRHRGMQMLDGAGNCERSITCFYHQWRYSLDGSLKVVPQRKEQFATIDTSDWGLLPASVGVWEGMVFAHPSPNAMPLADFVAPLAANMGSFKPGALTEVAALDLEANCNWKLFVENHIDVYHLWYLHEQTLGDFDHTKFEHTTVDGHWFSYEPLRGELNDAALTSGTAAITHLDERDRLGIGAHLLFPSLMVASAAEFFATYQAVPLAADRTRIELRIRAEASADADALLAATKSFIEEDIHACERVQAGTGSPAFAVGPLATEHEAPIARFQKHLLARIEEAA